MANLLNDIIFIGSGILFTLQILVGGVLIGLTVGTLLAILQRQIIFNKIIQYFISIIRGTPLILQLSLVYFTLPQLTGIKLNIMSTGILTLGIHSAAYIAEIMRAGIDSVPKQQFEAAKTLYISKYYMWKDIILPQVIRNIAPALINEVIGITKATSLIAVFGGMDIMRRAQLVASEQFTYFMPLCIAAIYYYLLILVIEYFGKKIEETVKIC